MNYIFIDEIQEIKEFERAIRSLLLNDGDLFSFNIIKSVIFASLTAWAGFIGSHLCE